MRWDLYIKIQCDHQDAINHMKTMIKYFIWFPYSRVFLFILDSQGGVYLDCFKYLLLFTFSHAFYIWEIYIYALPDGNSAPFNMRIRFFSMEFYPLEVRYVVHATDQVYIYVIIISKSTHRLFCIKLQPSNHLSMCFIHLFYNGINSPYQPK